MCIARSYRVGYWVISNFSHRLLPNRPFLMPPLSCLGLKLCPPR